MSYAARNTWTHKLAATTSPPQAKSTIKGAKTAQTHRDYETEDEDRRPQTPACRPSRKRGAAVDMNIERLSEFPISGDAVDRALL
jgi:hypothetical protein